MSLLCFVFTGWLSLFFSAVRFVGRFVTDQLYYLIASNIEMSVDGLTVAIEGPTPEALAVGGVSQTADLDRGTIGCEMQALQVAVQTLEVRQAEHQQVGALSLTINLKVCC